MIDPSRTRFTISYPDGLVSGPVTGRVFVAITHSIDRPYVVATGPGEIGGSERGIEPRLQAGSWKNRVPFFGSYQDSVPYFSPWVGSVPLFGADVQNLEAGEQAVVDGDTLGFPPRSLRDLPAGEYYVQAILNLYTKFSRSDGHEIWAHMDQWEGQRWNLSAGNPVTEVTKVFLDPDKGYDIHLSLVDTLPEPHVPADTEWVRRIKIQSPALTAFWGHPIYLGATALLPRGFDEHPEEQYPTIYDQGHFSLGPPLGFSDEQTPETEESEYMRRLRGLESGFDLYKQWTSDDFPRVVVVTLQHPTPYYDCSYAVDSANNGPYGSAMLGELIPAAESAWRLIPESYARTLTGGSTGGWISLALQIYHSTFFGGCWSFAPGLGVDLRRYGLVNLYSDPNAFTAPNREWLVPERVFYRSPDGQPEITIRQMSQLEAVLGSKGRSGELLDIKQATSGPVGEDGYPRPVWDKMTGEIDHEVSQYMRANGYDLRQFLADNWATIGRDLEGKLNVFCADMDDYYLNLGVYGLEDFLENTSNPYYRGSFTYGRPLDGHVWHPMARNELIRTMAAHMARRGQRPQHSSSIPARVAKSMA